MKITSDIIIGLFMKAIKTYCLTTTLATRESRIIFLGKYLIADGPAELCVFNGAEPKTSSKISGMCYKSLKRLNEMYI